MKEEAGLGVAVARGAVYCRVALEDLGAAVARGATVAETTAAAREAAV